MVSNRSVIVVAVSSSNSNCNISAILWLSFLGRPTGLPVGIYLLDLRVVQVDAIESGGHSYRCVRLVLRVGLVVSAVRDVIGWLPDASRSRGGASLSASVAVSASQAMLSWILSASVA